MVGDSFAGYTQWAAAEAGHPALVAITPRCACHDRSGQKFEGGVLSLESSVYWACETAVDEYLYDYPHPFDWSVRPVGEVLKHEVGSRRPGWIDDWAQADASEVATEAPIVPGRLRVLHLIGLFDHSVVVQYRTWEMAQAGAGDHHLVLDAVDHSWRGLATSGSDSVVQEDTARFMRRYHEHLGPFLDAAFAGSRYPYERVTWRPALDVPWREAASWPPPESRCLTLWASDPLPPGGRLVSEAPPERGWRPWRHDPAAPVPSRGHPFHELAERADVSDLAGRDDVADFCTEPFREMVELAGVGRFTATIRSSAAVTTLVVSLLDLAPDGTAREVRTGRSRVADARCAPEVTVELGPVAYRYLAGHRLGVRLSSSLFPRLALDSGNDSNTWNEWAPSEEDQAVLVGGPGGARLTCHVLTEGGER